MPRLFIRWVLNVAGVIFTAGIILMTVSSANAAPTQVNLGTAGSFAVLAGTTITNTGATTVTGDLGLSPGTAVTGFPPGIVIGTQHVADAVAVQAKTDLTTAYNDAAGQTTTQDLTGQDLGGLTLTPGVYSFSSSAQLTGTLTLDAGGDPDAVFIFQIGSALTTATDSKVILTGGAQACHVFWQVGSSATLGTDSNFTGNILALTSITAVTGATVDGRLLARNGAISLDTNTIVKSTCLATLHVITHVINDNGGTAAAADFSVHVKIYGGDVAGSPTPGAESPGTTYTLVAGTYVVSEDAFAGYSVSFSGDSDSSGNITLAPGDNKTVTITSNDNAGIPPNYPLPGKVIGNGKIAPDNKFIFDYVLWKGQNQPRGIFVYNSQLNKIKIKSSPNPDFLMIDFSNRKAEFGGNCTGYVGNAQAASFKVSIEDKNGAGGKDKFTIEVKDKNGFTIYQASEDLIAGNISILTGY